MYIPPAFRMEDLQKLTEFMSVHSFAMLTTHHDGELLASHLPVLHDPDRSILVSHMARANPQWKHLHPEREVLLIFQGPHAYISPSWYQTEQAVPTWNYAAVHVYGTPRILDNHEQVVELLERTVQTYEANRENPWSYNLPTDFRDKLVQSIVAFEIEITRIEGKWKLGQNRSQEDCRGVLTELSNSANSVHQQLASLMMDEDIV